jgi:antitoxin Phd
MPSWQVQDAKARFSELLDAAIEKGPQIVTRRGVEAAVLVPLKNGAGCSRHTHGT